MLKIVTKTDPVCYRLGTAEGIRAIAEAGFDGADVSMFLLTEPWYTDSVKFCKEAKAASRKYGLPFMQAHAPFPGRRYGDAAYNENMEPIVKRAVEVAGELEAGIIVVHPIHCPTLSAAEQMAWNIDYYMTLEPLCRKYGIKIALENMWGRRDGKIVSNVCSLGQELAEYASNLPKECFTVCADVGHFPLIGADPAAELRAIGEHLGALHIHNNDSLQDSHTFPFTGGIIDWRTVCHALADIDYKGHFTFEVNLAFTPTPLLPSALVYLAKTGKLLTQRIEEYKSGKAEKV